LKPTEVEPFALRDDRFFVLRDDKQWTRFAFDQDRTDLTFVESVFFDLNVRLVLRRQIGRKNGIFIKKRRPLSPKGGLF